MAFCPDELLLFKICSYLPAKAIYRFKCTCKTVSNIVEETEFATKQTENSLKKDDTCFFLRHETPQTYDEKVELYPLPGKQLSSGVSEDVLRFLSKSSTRMLASTKGLILLCLTTSNTYTPAVELFICNPATKSWSNIPSPIQVQEKQLYADPKMVLLEECSTGYMIIHFEVQTDWSADYPCNIYKSKEGLWKAMKRSFYAGGRNMKFEMPVYLNGAIHFISDCFPYLTERSPFYRPYIMSYNLESCLSTMLRVPEDATHDLSCDCEMSIFSWGKAQSMSICLVRLRKSVVTVWILTDYESHTWFRILEVATQEMGLREEDPKITGFTVINGDLLILATETRVYSYGLTDDGNCMRVEEICQHRFASKVCFTSYSDSLRLCGPGATCLPC